MVKEIVHSIGECRFTGPFHCFNGCNPGANRVDILEIIETVD